MIHSLIHRVRFCNLYFIRPHFSYCQKLFSTNHHILIAISLEVCHYSLTYESQPIQIRHVQRLRPLHSHGLGHLSRWSQGHRTRNAELPRILYQRMGARCQQESTRKNQVPYARPLIPSPRSTPSNSNLTYENYFFPSLSRCSHGWPCLPCVPLSCV
jgi:hypothetical protein